MASILRQMYTVKDESGKTIRKYSQYYYIDYKAAGGIRKRIKGYKDKTATLQLAAKLEKEAELADSGVVDKYKEHRNRPLAEHLENFKQSLLAKNITKRHAEECFEKIKKVFDKCEFNKWDDISASKILRTISEIQKTVLTVEIEKVNGIKIKHRKIRKLGVISAKTKNYYIGTIKYFCRWMVQDNRAGESPVENLKPIPLNGQATSRRALEPDDLRKLLETARPAKLSYGMTGFQRALLYQIAAETGLRASELRSLKISDIDFENNIIAVEAAYTKNRQKAEIPLKSDTALLLKDFIHGKLPGTKLFRLPHPCSLSRMIHDDLKAAKIDYKDTGSGKIDFHSLRHTFGTMLAASGVHPKTAQDLMRHSDINLTMSRYTHTLRGQTQKAIESLPDLNLPTCQSHVQKATGTDGQSALTNQLTKKLTNTAYSELAKVYSNGTAIHKKGGTVNCPKFSNDKTSGSKKDDLSLIVNKWAGLELNQRHTDFQSVALPTELPTRKFGKLIIYRLINSFARKNIVLLSLFLEI